MPCAMASRGTPKNARHGRGRGGVLRVVRAGQRGRRARSQDRPVASRSMVRVAASTSAGRSPEIATTRAGRRAAIRHGARAGIVDADHRQVAGCLAVEDRALRRGIAGHVAMAIDMVGAEVEHRRRIEAERGESLQHVGGHFQHVDAVVWQQRQRQRGGAEIAARRDGHAGAVQDVRQQRGGGGFAVGAGDAGEARARAGAAHRLEQQFHVGQDRHAGRDAPLPPPDAAAAAGAGCRATAPARRTRNRRRTDRAAARRRPRRARRRHRPRPTTSAPIARRARAPAGRSCPAPPRRSACRRTESAGKRSSDLQRRQADQRQDHRDDPEADDDGRLGPALLLEMVVQRRHQEHAACRCACTRTPGR